MDSEDIDKLSEAKSNQIQNSELWLYQTKEQDHSSIAAKHQQSEKDVQHVKQYMEYFEDIEKELQTSIIKLRQVEMEQESYFPEFTIFKFQHSQNYQIIVIQAKFGFYSCKFNIINTTQKSPFHTCHLSGFGSFGNVYTMYTDQPIYKKMQKHAIKCFPIDQQQKYHLYLNNILRQVFLLKLTNEALNCQDYKNDHFFYFDLIHYANCIQFSMERLKCNHDVASTKEHDLKFALRSFHKLGIVHCDIKEQNIAYNPTAGKWVFIDFGLSLIISEKQHQKTQVNFIGNFQNASPQMKKLYKSRQKGFVNLYYNDYFSLKITLTQMQQTRQKNLIATTLMPLNESILQLIDNFLFVIKLKYYLYGQNFDNQILAQLFQQFKTRKNALLQKIMFEYILQTKVTLFSRVFYDQLLIHKYYTSEYVSYKHFRSSINKNVSKIQQLPHQPLQYCIRFSHILHNKQNLITIDFLPQNIYQTLHDQNKIKNMDKKIYFTNILEFVSFTSNKYKRSTKQKISVCTVFQKVINQKDSQASLACINKTLTTILKYCMSLPFTKWKRQNLFRILTQIFIIGVGSNQLVAQLIHFIESSLTTTAQQVYMLYLIFQNFVWDHNVFIKTGTQIYYFQVTNQLSNLMRKIKKQYEQKRMRQYLKFRLKQNQSLTFKDSLQEDYLLVVYFLVNIGVWSLYEQDPKQILNIYYLMLNLVTRSCFIVTYGKEVFESLLNVGIKLFFSSCHQLSKNLIFVLRTFNELNQIYYYHIDIIHTLRRLKDTENVIKILQLLRQNINNSQIWQNLMFCYILMEEKGEQSIDSKQCSVLINKCLQIIKNPEKQCIRLVLNVFKAIEILSFINFSTLRKQYVFIKKYCKINYYDFIKIEQHVITFPFIEQQLKLIHTEASKVIEDFQELFDWKLTKYLSFVKTGQTLSFYNFGKYLDIPVIMKGYNYFYFFVRTSIIFKIKHSLNQNVHSQFLKLLYKTTKKNDSVSMILDSYQQNKRQFFVSLPKLKLLYKKHPNKNYFQFVLINNIDYLIAQQIKNIQKMNKDIYKSYILQIILKVNTAILLLIRQFFTMKSYFSWQTMYIILQKKIFHIQLQITQNTTFQRQTLALYIEYVGNLFATFDFLVEKIKKQNITFEEQYLQQIQKNLQKKVVNLEQTIRLTKTYQLIRYFDVLKVNDISFFKILLKKKLEDNQKGIIQQKILELITIMSQVYANRDSWKHFFLFKQLFQINQKFSLENMLYFIQIIIRIKWNHVANESLLKNYKLVTFISKFVCNLIDCLLTHHQNNRQSLLKNPILQLTFFSCVLTDHSYVIKLLKITNILVQKINLRDQIQILPFLLMIAILKVNQINSYSTRFQLYLHRKLIKYLIRNGWGNLFITYCKQYIDLCKKMHNFYFKVLFSKFKQPKNKNNQKLKQKANKYYHRTTSSQNNKTKIIS